MKSLTTAQERFGSSLPILKYDFPNGIRLAAPAGASISSSALAAGAYLVTASADAFLSTAGPSGDAAGSILLGAGVPLHLIIDDGQSISAAGAVLAASIFIVPLV